MKKNSRTLTIFFSYIILSSTALIAIDLSNNNGFMYAFAANQTNNTISNTTGATTNKTALLKPENFAANTVALDAKMLQLTASNKPQDIATLAYIWGYPRVTVAESYWVPTGTNFRALTTFGTLSVRSLLDITS